MGGRRWLAALVGVIAFAGCADRKGPADADGQLMALPTVVDFARVAMYATTGRSLTLHNVGPGLVAVQRAWIEGTDGSSYAADLDPSISSTLALGETRDLTVHFSPRMEGKHLAALLIQSDRRNHDVLRIPLDGVGVDARAILTGAPLDFGRIEAQSAKAKPVQLTNISDLPIQVRFDSVGPDGDEFSAQTLTLGPYERRAVDVTFAPARVGKKDAHLRMYPCEGCAAVPVTLIAEALDRAVIAEPPQVDFGGVPDDRQAARRARLHNISTEPMQVLGVSMAQPVDPSFNAAPVPFPVVLAPGETREFDLSYTAIHGGTATQTAMFGVLSKRNPHTDVELTGIAGAAELCVTPMIYDFGSMPVGSRNTVKITVRNCGSVGSAPLTVSSVIFVSDGSPSEDEFNLGAVDLPKKLNAGESYTFKAFFEPTHPGSAAATLRIQTDAYEAGQVELHFAGSAQTYRPCELQLTPATIDFGTVPPTHGAVLGVKLTNIGSQVCAVKRIHLNDSAGGTFGMPGGVIDGVIMQPTDWFSFQVSFIAPSVGGEFHGSVEIGQANPANPKLLVPLVAWSQTSCLIAQPPYLDFGIGRPDCPVAPLQTNLENQCTSPITLTKVAIGPGTTDGEFGFTQRPASLPLDLQPGQGATVGVGYQAQVYGMQLSPLFASTSELPHPYLVPLLGEFPHDFEQRDTFVQTDSHKLDILFVVDNPASMVTKSQRLVSAIPAFAKELLSRNLDVHVAVTTSGLKPTSDACPGGAQGGENGRFFPVDNSSPRILDQTTPNFASVLQNNVQVGSCTVDQPTLEAMRRALSAPLINNAKAPGTPQPNDGNLGFLRPDAALAVILVGDNEDTSPDDVQTYVNFLKTLKGENQPQRATLYAIGPTEQTCQLEGGRGNRFRQAANLTGGEILSDCADDYSPLLVKVADKAFGLQQKFPLSKAAMQGTISVNVNGNPATGWSYDAASNSVVFNAAPPPGSTIEVAFRRDCGA